MLPFVLVLLVASSALAAPSVGVTQYGINELPRPSLNSLRGLVEASAELVDGADQNIYSLSFVESIKDLANGNAASQALALSQLLALLGELSTGLAGDSCEAAAVINSYASGNTNAGGFLRRQAANIDNIARLAANPNSQRYARGPVGNCAGGGRSYQFEAAWDGILNSSSNLPLANEEYCAARRLYNAFNVRSNNVGAAVTAASIPAVTSAVARAQPQIVNFLNVVARGGNANAAAASARAALLA